METPHEYVDAGRHWRRLLYISPGRRRHAAGQHGSGSGRYRSKGRLNGAYRLTVYVCHAFCSKVQATSTDLLFGAGGAPGRLRYDRVSTWCSLAGLSLGLLGSRVPSTTYNLSRQLLSRALQRLASDEGEEPEARQHGYRQLDTRPRHPDRPWSSRRLSGGSGTSKSLT